MSIRRRLCRGSAKVFVAVLTMLVGTFGFSGALGAAEEASGSAFGLSADGLIDIDPEPEAAFPPGGQETTVEVDLGGLLLACVLNASSRGFTDGGAEVDTVAEADRVTSTASVASATLLGDPDADCENGDTDEGSGGLVDFLDDLVDDLLGGSGITLTAIASQCTADADGVDGQSTVVGLGDEDDELIDDLLGDGLDLNELAIDLGLDIDLDLGILELVLDEQIIDSDGNGITVRALRLTLLPGDGGDEPLQEVILAESRCRFVGDDDDEKPKPDDDGDHNQATNESDVINVSDGTAVIETGDATAVGNVSETEIDQSADASGGASVDQEASVENEGEADANTGENTAIGNNSTNVAANEQTAVAVGDGGAGAADACNPCAPGQDGDGNDASNESTVANVSDGTAVIDTGDASAVGNVSATEIDQSATATGNGGCGDRPCVRCPEPDDCPEKCPEPKDDDCPQECPEPKDDDDCPQECPERDDDPCHDDKDDDVPCGGKCTGGWGARGRDFSSADQSASVSNSGSARANTGGNTAIGNNSTNVASNSQQAVAASD